VVLESCQQYLETYDDSLMARLMQVSSELSKLGSHFSTFMDIAVCTVIDHYLDDRVTSADLDDSAN
jgi:hypothetical protein